MPANTITMNNTTEPKNESLKISDLNNTQLILLALLVSFVTSMATGIVTVTLMDQAPPGVTQTINRVIEKTVQVVTPATTQTSEVIKTIMVREDDLIAAAVARGSGNVVHISFVTEGTLGEVATSTATGFVVSEDGIVALESRRIPSGTMRVIAQGPAGIPIVMKHLTTSEGMVSLFAPAEADAEKLAAVLKAAVFETPSFATDAPRLGQSALALGTDGTPALLVGVVSRIDTSTTTPAWFETTMTPTMIYGGGPVLDLDGNVLGLMTIGVDGKHAVVPASALMHLIKVVSTR